MSEFPPSLSLSYILLGHHQALQVGSVDHALINLHIDLEGLEGGKDDVVVVGASGHLGSEQGDHLGEVHGSIHLIEHGLGLSATDVLAVGTEGSDEIGGGEE